jgi:hypothetical protein
MLEPETALYVIDEYERGWLDDADEASALEPHREDVAERLAEEDEHLALEARLSWIRYARRELAALIEERDGGGKS